MRGAERALLATALWLVLVAAASAGEFEFLPPAPTRNFQPIQLIFLNLPFERAVVLPPGDVALQAQTAEINEIATSSGAIDSTLKFESNRTVFGFRVGVWDGWEAGLELPFISRFGGFLDPVINGAEEFFGAVNPERRLFPEHTFGGFSVARGDTSLFAGGEVTFQPGDLSFLVKRQLRLPESWPRLALRGAVKAPTGDPDEVLGSGEPDFGLGVAADYQPWERLMLYGNLNLVYPVGPLTDGDLTLNPFVGQSFAAHLAITRHWSVFLHEAVYTSPFHGTGAALLDGTVVELGFGLNVACGERFGAQLLGIQNMSGVEQAADFTLMLALQWRPWAQTTDLPPVGPPLPPPTDLPPLGPPPHPPS